LVRRAHREIKGVREFPALPETQERRDRKAPLAQPLAAGITITISTMDGMLEPGAKAIAAFTYNVQVAKLIHFQD
jgi:hypothetical protein